MGDARVFNAENTRKIEPWPPRGSCGVSGPLQTGRSQDQVTNKARAGSKRRPQWPSMTRRSGFTCPVHVAPSIPTAMPISAWSWHGRRHMDRASTTRPPRPRTGRVQCWMGGSSTSHVRVVIDPPWSTSAWVEEEAEELKQDVFLLKIAPKLACVPVNRDANRSPHSAAIGDLAVALRNLDSVPFSADLPKAGKSERHICAKSG